MIEVGEWVNFRIVIERRVLEAFGCNHELSRLGPQPTSCRPCSISTGLVYDTANIEIRWADDQETWGRVVSGRYRRGEKQSLALTRLIAFAMGHRDPLELVDQTRQWSERTPLWQQ